MSKFLISTLSVLFFMTYQSFAMVCAETCQLNSIKAQYKTTKTTKTTKIIKTAKASAGDHNCHGQGQSNPPAKPHSTSGCGMTLCAQIDIQLEFSDHRVSDNTGAKKVFLQGEVLVPNQLLATSNVIFNGYDSNLLSHYLKIPIYLQLQKFII